LRARFKFAGVGAPATHLPEGNNLPDFTIADLGG